MFYHLMLLLLCLLLMSALWFVQYRIRNAGYVDVAWAGLIGMLAVIHGVTGDGGLLARILAAALGGLWSLRLTVYLWRRVHRQPEDGRYQALRQNLAHNPQAWWLAFFWLQGILAWAFGWVFWVVANNAEMSVGLSLIGIAIWFVAVAGESLADRQLAAFRQQHPGLTCNVGLWRYSRHPNYFFEWLHWLAYPWLAWGHDAAWIAWLAPLLMLMFLYRVTGIPHTERQALRSRGENYRQYQQQTSAFFPWPPKSRRNQV